MNSSHLKWSLCLLHPLAFPLSDILYAFYYPSRYNTCYLNVKSDTETEQKSLLITMVHRLIGPRNFFPNDFSNHFPLLKICCPAYSGSRTIHLSNVTHGLIVVVLGRKVPRRSKACVLTVSMSYTLCHQSFSSEHGESECYRSKAKNESLAYLSLPACQPACLPACLPPCLCLSLSLSYTQSITSHCI